MLFAYCFDCCSTWILGILCVKGSALISFPYYILLLFGLYQCTFNIYVEKIYLYTFLYEWLRLYLCRRNNGIDDNFQSSMCILNGNNMFLISSFFFLSLCLSGCSHTCIGQFKVCPKSEFNRWCRAWSCSGKISAIACFIHIVNTFNV